MAQQVQTRRNRQPSPERWARAAQRAMAEHIEVRQVNTNGMWTANSGSDPQVAYLLEVNQGIVVSCSCPAGQFGDLCCKHAAKFYIDAGLLDPEPDPPAPGAVLCFRCQGAGAVCAVCAGAGIAPVARQAAALVAAAAAGVCDRCGGPLDADAVTDDALVTVCGACADANQDAARAAWQDAISAAHAQHVAARDRLAA